MLAILAVFGSVFLITFAITLTTILPNSYFTNDNNITLFPMIFLIWLEGLLCVPMILLLLNLNILENFFVIICSFLIYIGIIISLFFLTFKKIEKLE